MKEQRKITEWTKGTSEWAIVAAEIRGNCFQSRMDKFLKMFMVGSAPFELVTDTYKVVIKHRKLPEEFNKDFYGTEARVMPILITKCKEGSWVTDDRLWEVFTSLMLKHLPHEVESNEEKLRACKRSKKETIEAFLHRFQCAFRKYPVEDKLAARVLYEQLPSYIKTPLSAMPVKATLEEVMENVKNVNYWEQKPNDKKEIQKGEDSSDMMDIDLICNSLYRGPSNQRQSTYNFKGISNFFTLKAAVKHLYHKDQQFATFLKSVVSKEHQAEGSRPTQRRTIFEVAEEDNPQDEDDIEFMSDHGETDASAGFLEMIGMANVCAAQEPKIQAGAPLFCPVKLNNRLHVNGFLDCGASISIISPKIAARTGCKVEGTNAVLRCANDSPLQVSGCCNMAVTVGNSNIQHRFYVCENINHQLILGQDFLYLTKGKPNAHKRVLELPNQTAIQCLAVQEQDSVHQEEAQQDLHTSPQHLIPQEIHMKCHDHLQVLPVQKQGVVYFAAGRSFIIAANDRKTVVLPVKPSQALQFADANKLPPGVFAISSVWCAGAPLRITVVNSSTRSIHVGSKTALIGIILDKAHFILHTCRGHIHRLHNAIPESKLPHEINAVKDNKDLESYKTTFPKLFQAKAGRFNKDIVSYLQFTSTPDTSQLYQTPLAARYLQAAQEQVKAWLANDIITKVESTPKAISPIILTPKPRSDKLRLCLDFRLLNSCIKAVHSPQLDRQSILRNLAKHSIFSTVDVSAAFTCVELAPELRPFFGIEVAHQYYVFNRLPFGFHNSMAYFLRAINYTLNKVREKLPESTSIYSYVDDIAVASNNLEEHHQALQILFQTMEEDGWNLDPAKAQLCQPAIAFLGVYISDKGIEMDASVLHKLEDLPTPTCSQDLRAFFGLCLGLIPFSPTVSADIQPLRCYTAAPMEQFTSEKFKTLWTKIVPALTKKLWRPTFYDIHSKEQLTVWVDSSSSAHGAALFQGNKLIALWSQGNNKSFSSSCYAELAGFCKAILAFQCYLINQPFIVYTDNRAVIAAFTAQNHTPFVLRNLHALQQSFCYPLQVAHIAGKENILADMLSRHAYLTKRKRKPETQQYPLAADTQGKLKELGNLMEMSKDEIQKEYERLMNRDHDYKSIMEQIKNGMELPGWKWVNGMLQKEVKSTWVRVIPKEMTKEVMRAVHDRQGHYGNEKTLEKASKMFYWKTMQTDIAEYCRTCETCQKCMHKQPSSTLGTITGKRPFDTIAIDFMGPLKEINGYKYILIAVDYNTRWPEFRITKTTRTEEVITLLEQIKSRFGLPKEVITDNAASLTSDSLKKFLSNHNIERLELSPYSPKSNGLVERMVQTVKTRLQRACKGDESKWLHMTQEAFENIRMTSSNTIGMSPVEALLGFHPRYSGEEVTNALRESKRRLATENKVKATKRAQERHARVTKTNARKHMHPGDMVMMRDSRLDGQRSGKFKWLWKGPYELVEQVRDNLFKLKKINGEILKGVIHRDRLLRYYIRREA